jgi:FRG domain-containing protein
VPAALLGFKVPVSANLSQGRRFGRFESISQVRTNFMKAAVTSYRELTEELSKLRKPVPGRVRVYRGQPQDFGIMLPTGLRPGAGERDPIWRYFAMAVSRELSARTSSSPADDSVWIEAIAQHYGPGSPFLDVTKSLAVALWFAVHERRPVFAEHLVGPPGPPDEARGIPAKETWWEYRPLTGHGYLYVFDVPEWNRVGSPPHGTLLDVSSRPILSKSTRIQVQEACLVAADGSIKAGNLQEFYACDPIPVSRPTDGAPGIDDPTDLLFPDLPRIRGTISFSAYP